MMETIPEGLRRWARVYRSGGGKEEADLLEQAATLIERGEHDASMAAHLFAFSMVATDKGHGTFASTLRGASDAVRLAR